MCFPFPPGNKSNTSNILTPVRSQTIPRTTARSCLCLWVFCPPKYRWAVPDETPEELREHPGIALRANLGISLFGTAGSPQALQNKGDLKSLFQSISRIALPSIRLLGRMAQKPNRNRKPEPSEPFFPETGSGTGTAGTVFQEPKPESEPSFSVKTVLKHAQNPFQRRTVGADNRNRSNRPVQEP